MRVIEPKVHKKIPSEGIRGTRRKIAGFIIISLTLGFVVFAFTGQKTLNESVLGVFGSASPTQTSSEKTKTYKYFSDADFEQLYESIAYPNTQPITEPPQITANRLADERIREIAESRGYRLRSVPLQPIIDTKEPGLGQANLLQPLAYQSWTALKAQAKRQGFELHLSSGYRSIDLQRQMFLEKLQAFKVSSNQIAAGTTDDALVTVLQTTAPPGYSREHTGYTLDLTCGTAQQPFDQSPCYKWLSANNYLNAKTFGFIPSYPEGADNQGPASEPWEYVWVGVTPLQN